MTAPHPTYPPTLEAMEVLTDTEMATFIAALAERTSPKNEVRPPWSWPNLTVDEITRLDLALDQFVATYNHVHVVALDEVIPACWRKHPALAQEMPVQFWAWWASHSNPTSTINQAVDYYGRILPQFQHRLQNRLLGKSAGRCRLGEHETMSDPDLDKAIRFDPLSRGKQWGRTDTNRARLHGTDFGTQVGRY